MKKVLFSALVVGLLAGCAGQDVKEQSKAAVEDRTATQAGADTKGAGQQSVSANPLTDPNNILSKRSVYFDLDKYVANA